MKNDNSRRQFASDNYSGVCPEAWKALEEANRGHVRSYGDDAYTARAADLIRELFSDSPNIIFPLSKSASRSKAA